MELDDEEAGDDMQTDERFAQAVGVLGGAAAGPPLSPMIWYQSTATLKGFKPGGGHASGLGGR